MTAGETLRDEGDRFLLARINEGDPEAFRQLVDRFSGRLEAFAQGLLAGTGLEAEDAVQETFLALLQSLDRLPSIRSLQAFLFSVARNKAMDLIRRSPQAHGGRVTAFGEESRAGAPEPIAPGATPSAYARAAGTSEPTVSRIRGAAIDALRDACARDRRAAALGALEPDGRLLSRVWRENLLSCPKRSTLGAYELGVLEEPWASHVAFHLDVVACEVCRANRDDLREGSSEEARRARERIYASSAGFLKPKRR